ncbi:hypothetical protein [Alteriqipengyuania lutimaris]|uniref:Uncharacterized protein n=1 Tax=Alteriqipengyuania lutimaris TaxID=1538146 RepID=A0A395LI57_9SPHN|nr:hypothetical protein [Alteriqipengyuania lutimaris]MBB3035363.1 hypothetical protein [Alteriqipengyuania lutimaris]RDS75947.1 hypothetical protein DL238_14845 [Alteriqipengyuania lutimaris]
MANPCPPLSLLVSDTTAELLEWAAATAILYAKCQARHRGAVASYAAARATAIEANGKAPED